MTGPYSFFDPVTGRFHGMVFSGPQIDTHPLVEEGFRVYLGSVDHLRYRVTEATRASEAPQLEEFVPPAPAGDEYTAWQWDAYAWRWRATRTLAGHKRDQLQGVNNLIAEQEARRTRPASEAAMALASGQPVPQAALVPLQQTEAALQQLRAVRQAIELASSQAELDAITWP